MRTAIQVMCGFGIAVAAGCATESEVEAVAEVVEGNCGVFLSASTSDGEWLSRPGDPAASYLRSPRQLESRIEVDGDAGTLRSGALEIIVYRRADGAVMTLDGCFDPLAE